MNISAQTVLQTIIRRESRSLLQYVHEAYPWTRADGQELLAALAKLTAEEAHSTATLATLLQRRLHAPLPYLGSYPQHFTSFNYVELSFLLARLVEEQTRAIAALQRDLAALEDAEVRAAVAKVLEMKQRHLKKLEELAAPVPA